MAITTMTTSNSLTVKKWSAKGFIDIYKASAFGHMLDRGTIMRASELDRAEAGDAITFNFTGILQGLGQTEGGTLTGNEEALNNQGFAMSFNVVRHAVANPNTDTIEQARPNFSFEERSRKLLPKWHASRLDASVFNQLAGITATSSTVDGAVYTGAKLTIVSGLNTINAPSTNRIVWAGNAGADESLTSSQTMTLDLIDAAVEIATTTYPTIAPLANEEFDLYCHPYQILDLKRDTTGKIQWYNNQLAATAGGKGDLDTASAYELKAVGKYANVVIYSRNRVPLGVNSSTSAVVANTRRAVMCGGDAMAFASKFSGAVVDLAQTKGNTPLKFFKQLKDYEYIAGIEARMIYGVKKLQFTATGATSASDYGSIVISTYAAAHTS